MRHVLAPLPAAVLGVLLVTGCTGGSPASTPAASPGGSPSEASTSSAPAVPARHRAAPATGSGAAELTRPTNASRPVPCGGVHTAVTIYVGRLDTRVTGTPWRSTPTTVTKQLAPAAGASSRRTWGVRAPRGTSGRFNVVWFSPTLEQSGRGADWFRCDLIAFDRADALLALPPARSG